MRTESSADSRKIAVPSWLLIALFMMLSALPLPGRANEAQLIVTAGPSWPRFTNQDGQGLYHEIVSLIFSPEYEIKHIYTTTYNANNLVALGRADIKMCETAVEQPLQLGAYPMYENTYYAVFPKGRAGSWKGIESLRGRKVTWRKGYYSQADFSVPVEGDPVHSGEAALMLLVLNRADYYIDDLALIEESFATAEKKIAKEDFVVKEIGRRPYYPVFSSSPRGNMLKAHYDAAYLRLYRAKQLQRIYERWDFPIPQLDPQ